MNNKGFTLIELLVVVLIIGILAAMALPQYFKAVERSRMSEAVTLMASIVQSQRRKYLQIDRFVSDFRGLDVAPKNAAGNAHCTKGTPTSSSWSSAEDCNGGNGFILAMNGTDTNGFIKAGRANGENGQYKYELERYYTATGVLCRGVNQPGADLCADFCGVQSLSSGGACCTDGSICPNGGVIEGTTCYPSNTL